MKKVIILSRDLGHSGGVVNYTGLLLKNFPRAKFQMMHFVQGRSPHPWKNIFLPINIFFQFIRFNQILKKYKPDLVHINPSLEINSIIRDSVFLWITNNHNIPTIFFVRGWNKLISDRFYDGGIITRFFRWIFKMPKMIIVLAREFKEDLENLGIESNKIRLETTMARCSDYINQGKIFEKPYRLLFCSRMESNKGIYELLVAFALVLRKHPKTKLTYMGDGSELKNLKSKIIEMNLSKNVRCIGRKIGTSKIREYQASDMFVFPTYHGEGFPNVYCEAMASGLPIITTHKGGLKDVFEDCKQGLLLHGFPPRSREIALRIIQLLESPYLMNRISTNNFKESKKKYDVKVVCKRIENIYKEVEAQHK